MKPFSLIKMNWPDFLLPGNGGAPTNASTVQGPENLGGKQKQKRNNKWGTLAVTRAPRNRLRQYFSPAALLKDEKQ